MNTGSALGRVWDGRMHRVSKWAGGGGCRFLQESLTRSPFKQGCCPFCLLLVLLTGTQCGRLQGALAGSGDRELAAGTGCGNRPHRSKFSITTSSLSPQRCPCRAPVTRTKRRWQQWQPGWHGGGRVRRYCTKQQSPHTHTHLSTQCDCTSLSLTHTHPKAFFSILVGIAV